MLHYAFKQVGTHTYLFFLSILSLVLSCCSCRQRIKRIVVPAVTDGKNVAKEQSTLLSAVKTKNHYDLPYEIRGCSDYKDETYDPLDCEARLADVPIFPKATPVAEYFAQSENEEGVVLSYLCQAERQEIRTFYENQMKGLGWRILASANSFESTQVFQKPDRLCIVSVRHHRCKGSKCQQMVISIPMLCPIVENT